MTKEFEQYHGIVFTRILHGLPEPVKIGVYPTKNNSSYVLDDRAGLYIKYSTNRMSPWRFTFLKAHQDEVAEMQKNFGEVFTALVCKDDGIVLLNFQELKSILDHNHGESEWVAVTRGRRTQYSVSGSDGELDFKVSQKSCPNKILEYFQINAQTSEQPRTSSFFPKVLSFLSG